jgi:hypothetical protein
MKATLSSRSLAPVVALLCLLFGAAGSFGCETIEIPPLELDPNEVVLIGTVIDVEQNSPAQIKVRLQKLIHAAHSGDPKREYTISLYGLGADCSKVPASREAAREYYPPGTDVWVIATVDPHDGSALEVWSGMGTYIERNSGAQHVKARNVNDYCPDPSFDFPSSRLAFELRKDLLRLRQAASEKAKADILRRLAFHPHFRGWASPELFGELVNRYLDHEKLIQDVMLFHEQRVKGRIVPLCSGWRSRCGFGYSVTSWTSSS